MTHTTEMAIKAAVIELQPLIKASVALDRAILAQAVVGAGDYGANDDGPELHQAVRTAIVAERARQGQQC